jgi:hypothetical protein
LINGQIFWISIWIEDEMQIQPININWFVNKINNNEPFSFVRYGDGEWRCICGYKGKNCDRHDYLPDLRKALTNAVMSKNEILFGMQPKAMKDMRVEILNFLKRHSINRKWVNADVFHKANCQGKLFPFIRAMSNSKVGIIGPPHIKDSGISFHHFVEILTHNCFSKVDGVYKRTLDAVKECTILLFCASMMSNVLIDRLNRVIGDRVTMIDCGSIFDPYAGVASRGIFRSSEYDWEKLKRINIKGKSTN